MIYHPRNEKEKKILLKINTARQIFDFAALLARFLLMPKAAAYLTCTRH
jgi:hypothetical protein